MGDAVAEDGTVYKSHYLISPLDNEDLIKNTCSECHTDLEGQVRAIQAGVMARETEIGNKLEAFHNKLAEAVAGGSYSEEELNAIRDVLRSAQFYWDFVFVENSEGAHNSALTKQCLDKSEALIEQGMAMFK
jgi:nitrite reductase (cytochrome c-552)